MGRRVQIRADFTSVLLPDGRAYDASAQAILTDAEFAALPAETLRAIDDITGDASIPDPSRGRGGWLPGALLLDANEPVPPGTPPRTLIYRMAP